MVSKVMGEGQQKQNQIYDISIDIQYQVQFKYDSLEPSVKYLKQWGDLWRALWKTRSM